MKKTFGKLAFKKGKWIITAEPHVMVRLKRVFPRVVQTVRELEISGTLEVARDLDWFLSRFPLAMSRATRARLVEEALAYDKRAEEVHQIVLATTSDLGFELAEPARDYQKVAAALASHTGALLLADDMGVGKTVSAIALLAMPGKLPALVATPAGLVPKQWQRQLARFAPQLKTHVLKGTKPYDLAQVKRGRGDAMQAAHPDVVISTYHRLSGWRDYLAGKFRTCVGDEIQKLKGDTEMSRAWDHIAEGSLWRMGLSGTPIHNLGSEMFPVMERLAPGRLGTKYEFLREWCSEPDRRDRASLSDPAAFGTYLRSEGLLLRRTRKDVGRELPPFTKVIEQVEWDKSVLDSIKKPAAELARRLLSSAKLDERRDAGRDFDLMLRQATGVAKAVAVADLVRMAVESGEPVLLYGWHHAVYDLWAERLKDLSPGWVTGNQTDSQKGKHYERFIAGETPVLVMSLRSGLGLDGLQHVCSTVVFGELDFSPAVMEQCATRVFRDEQTKPVVAYYPICEDDDSSDPVLIDLLGVKRAQLDGVRDPAGGFLEELDTGGERVKRLARAYLSKLEAA